MLNTGNAFLSKMLPALEDGDPLGVPEEEIRSPIDVVTLGQALMELGRNDFQGVIHLSNNDIFNRLEMVQRIAKHAGFTKANIHANDPSKIPDRAPRPRDVSFLNDLARASLETEFVSLEAAFDRVMDWDKRLHG
jgi:dTDP-4-dehydrorhamnose reductase